MAIMSVYGSGDDLMQVEITNDDNVIFDDEYSVYGQPIGIKVFSEKENAGLIVSASYGGIQ